MITQAITISDMRKSGAKVPVFVVKSVVLLWYGD